MQTKYKVGNRLIWDAHDKPEIKIVEIGANAPALGQCYIIKVMEGKFKDGELTVPERRLKKLPKSVKHLGKTYTLES